MPIALKVKIGAVSRVLRGQDHFWLVMRKLGRDGQTFSAVDVFELSEETHIGTVTSYVRRLADAGILAQAGTVKRASNGAAEATYRLVKSPEDAPLVSRDGAVERPRSAQQQMWNLMRSPVGRSGFTWSDLVSWASTDDLEIKPNTAKSYILALRQSGYLLTVDQGGPNRPGTWRLKPSMNTGPKPPRILRAKIVWDQNREKVVGDVVAEEEPS